MTESIHAVAWREGEGEIAAGRLRAAVSHLELDASPAAAVLRIAADDIAAARIGRDAGERVYGRPALVLERRSGPHVYVTAVLGIGLTHELAVHVQHWLAQRPLDPRPAR